ncbi:MAG: UvrB/UvrC motif-containing protein [Gemmatimonadota bacterium]|nr:UvrB/UvrC motif-containing protein [Gemmatimonadota bacterium]
MVHLTSIVDNAVTQVHLCERCAAEKGVETTVALPTTPLGALIKAAQQQLPGPVRDGTACTVCGLTLREFRASGRLGCPACYGAFDQPLRDLLKRVHGDHTHAGRRYEPPLPEGAQRQNSLLELRAALKRAIDAEQFEQAASLRDQIRGLE